jgi:hypothetical protein
VEAAEVVMVEETWPIVRVARETRASNQMSL